MPARRDKHSTLGGCAVERAFYDQMDWERYAANPQIALKMRLTAALIPSDASTILDAGCGNGSLTNPLVAPGRLVIGLDSSRQPLRTVTAHAVRAAVESLPLADQSVDLVLLSEVLERPPDAILEQCVAEAKRVSRKYLLIASPNREAVRTRYLRCSHCGHEFNAYLHVQSLAGKTDSAQRRKPTGACLPTWSPTELTRQRAQ
ncbi:MAG: class I SAM-dependent methyltransferase [Armatimonadota bacterium]|nr:MAG: class I SAM-dependent methyltransferase [Armatimonadota bacterium]